MKRFLLLLLVMIATCPVLADSEMGNQTTPTLVVPKGSGLTTSDVTPDPTETASFSGQVWVRGVLLAQWPDGDDGFHQEDKIEVSLKLDEEERRRLPYYDWPEWSRTYIPDSIDITNPEAAVKIVFPKELSTSILKKKVHVAKVHAKFLLTDYAIGVECDAPWARAKLVSASVTDVAQIGGKSDLVGC